MCVRARALTRLCVYAFTCLHVQMSVILFSQGSELIGRESLIKIRQVQVEGNGCYMEQKIDGITEPTTDISEAFMYHTESAKYIRI